MTGREEALRRLDAIEAEAKELRKAIDRMSNRIICDPADGVYVANRGCEVYILLGDYQTNKYNWYSLYSPVSVYTNQMGAQEAIDYLISKEFSVRRFSTRREALIFLLEAS